MKLGVGVIGTGERGQFISGLLGDMAADAAFPYKFELACVCDLNKSKAAEAARLYEAKANGSPSVYSDEGDFFSHPGLDAVIIATSWQTHIPLAIRAMRQGIRPGIECGGAQTLAHCFELVKVYEETGISCMFLENCVFGREEMALKLMCERGMFGELVHIQCGYQHDLRSLLSGGFDEGSFRLRHHLHRNAELYPMHGLGPMMKLL
ncbi:MAG: Gfo/Idh/MocA family oxidoreductase, partial [Defluviitaleaceae bacterium]|nr:Gfo/Idh/MocA family oxidoreductase [Defluviitaleaceae bacterium]